jgi:DNA-binding Lrp family transcriptional regulator
MATPAAIRCALSIISNLKADEKFFLICLILSTERVSTPGDFVLIEKSGVLLAKSFRFTKEASFRALSKLTEHRFIAESTDQGKLGRPRKFRKIIDRSWERGETTREVLQTNLVEQASKLISHRLKYGNRAEYALINNALFMLLIILVLKADRAGVIIGTSQADLSRYSGIPRPQIQRRIKQLQELEIITEIIPGLVEGKILGKQSSIYYLNLNHPALASMEMPTEPMPIAGKGFSTLEIDQIIMSFGHTGLHDRLAIAEQHASTTPGLKMTRISSGSWKENAGDALNRVDSRLHLQSAIERFAAKLLANPNLILSESHWRRAQDYASADFVFEITGRRPSTIKMNKNNRHMFYSLCADLEELAHQLASVCLRIGKLPRRLSRVESRNTVYRILPSGIGTRTEIKLEKVKLTP